MVTKPKPDKELAGLVYGLTPIPSESHLPLYKRPIFGAVVVALSLIICESYLRLSGAGILACSRLSRRLFTCRHAPAESRLQARMPAPLLMLVAESLGLFGIGTALLGGAIRKRLISFRVCMGSWSGHSRGRGPK